MATALSYLFSFQGRINRAKFWLFYAMQLLFFLPALGVGTVLTGGESLDDPSDWRLWVTIALLIMSGLVMYVAMAAIYVKRLHDRNKSAWWLAIFYGPTIPLLAALLFMMPDNGPPMFLPFLGLIFFPVWLLQMWAFIELHFLPGTVGDNRFGPDPLARG